MPIQNASESVYRLFLESNEFQKTAADIALDILFDIAMELFASISVSPLKVNLSVNSSIIQIFIFYC